MFTTRTISLALTTLALLGVLTLLLEFRAENASAAQEAPSPPLISTEELNQLYAEGRFSALINAVKLKEQQEQASDQDFLLASKAYLGILDAIGAALELEKVGIALRKSDDFILTQAKVLILEGQANRARTILTSRTLSETSLAEADLMLGDIAFVKKEYDTAKGHYDSAINANERDSRFYIARAQANMALNDMMSAEDDARKAILLDEKNTLTHYTLGVVYSRTGRLSEAEKQFQTSLQYFAGNLAAQLGLVNIKIIQGDYEQAELLLDKVFALAPDNSTAKFFSLMLAAARGDDESTRVPLSLLLAVDEKNPQTRRLLGHVAYRLGENNAARQQLEYVLSVAPYDRVSRLALGEVYLRLGQPDEALKTLEPLADAEQKNDFAALAMAGQAAAQTSNFDRAVAYTAQAIELANNPGTILNSEIIAGNIFSPSMVVFKRQLATYHFQNNNPTEATKVLEDLISADYTDVTSVLLLSNLHLRNGDFDGAIDAANSLIAKAPESAVGYNAKGAALHRKGERLDAIVAYTKAIELNEDYISARQNRGALFLEMNEYKAAASDLQIVLNKLPDDATTQLMLARALMNGSTPKSAMPLYQELDQSHPNSPSVAFYYAKALAAIGEYEQALYQVEKSIGLNNGADNALLEASETFRNVIKSRLEEPDEKTEETIPPQS